MASRHVALAAILALAAACSGATASPPSTTTRPAPATTTTTKPVVSLLTGKTVTADVARRPVLAVKVENSPQSRPQEGFENADMVVEEVVEGGITRFILLFQSTDPDEVGPVRSARPVDADVLVQFGKPIITFAGAIPEVVRALADAGLVLVDEDTAPPAVLGRRDDRAAPHNLYLS